MTMRLIADSSAGEIRTSLIDGDHPLEIHLTRGAAGQTGAIRLARVTHIAPETDAAFVDLGEGLEGFLPRKYAANPKAQRISDAVKEGQMLGVELVAPPSEPGKGWLVRADLRFHGRYVTLEPDSPGLRFAANFSDDTARDRLQEALSPVTGQCGVRIHGPAAQMDDDPVLAEAAQLLGQMKAVAAAGGGPRMIRPAPGPLERALRDAPVTLARIDVSDRALLAHAKKLCQRWPDLAPLLTLWTGEEPLFTAMGIEDAIDRIACGVIPLPSGGSLILDETRAATVIDVNSGAVTSPRMAAMIRKQTNEEAATAITRLLRLANIGGLVVVDFIDMHKTSDKDALYALLDQGLAADPAPTRRSGIDIHGILSITRRRKGLSLSSQICERHDPTPLIDQTGHNLLRQAERDAQMDPRPGTLCLKVGPRLGLWLGQNDRLKTLQDRTGRSVRLEVMDDGRDTDAQCHIAP